MNNVSTCDELDLAIDRMLAAAGSQPEAENQEVLDLLPLASDLRQLPRPDFKTRLAAELNWEASGRQIANAPQRAAGWQAVKGADPALLSLFGKGQSVYPVRRANFAASIGVHAALIVLCAVGLVAVKETRYTDKPHEFFTTLISPYVPPVGSQPMSGGGSGGNLEKTRASYGARPDFAQEQMAPPVVVQEQESKLMVKPTVVGPPEMNVASKDQVGNPLADLAAPSNGPGIHGGIGNNSGGGVGSGRGVGVGPGTDGGTGGNAYSVGNGVSAPRVIYSPDPQYSEEARKVKFQGTVVLLAIIDADGHPRNLHVQRSLGMGLDERALEAVSTWRFEPGRKDGHPVPVQISVEVSFHLY